MKRLLALVLAVMLVVAVPVAASAGEPREAPPRAVAAGGESRVVPLGLALWHGRLVEGYAFVHGRAAAVKPPKPSADTRLYTFLARGAKLRSTEAFVVNAANADGVGSSAIMAAMNTAASTWEAQVTTNIFGDGSPTNDALAADWKQPDGVNEVYFSETELDSGTVAVTVVWGIFSGSQSTREIFEWDMVFNDGLAEPWGEGLDDGWDVLEIATHEIGHSAGLGDLYTSSATEQTMYGYASVGEIKKRTLESGDIAGIKALYP